MEKGRIHHSVWCEPDRDRVALQPANGFWSTSGTGAVVLLSANRAPCQNLTCSPDDKHEDQVQASSARSPPEKSTHTQLQTNGDYLLATGVCNQSSCSPGVGTVSQHHTKHPTDSVTSGVQILPGVASQAPCCPHESPFAACQDCLPQPFPRFHAQRVGTR